MIYVPDTHALLWFLAKSPRLSKQARNAFVQVKNEQAEMFVPAIVVAEMIWIVRAGRIQVDLTSLLKTVHVHYTVVPFSVNDAMQLYTLPDSLTIHDAMIVWEAKKRNAHLITRDEMIIAAAAVPTIW